MVGNENMDDKDKKIAKLEKEIKFVKNQMANALSLYDEAKQEADKAIKAKGEFMSKLSHEFRTPMNALMGYSDLLIKREDNEITKRYASGIKSATNRLLNLFNDLIEVSRIESGISVCNEEEYEFAVLINTLMDSISHEVTEKGLIMKLNFDEDLPKRLYGDFYHLRQIISNLLDNAVKYTEKGYISLDIHATRGDEVAESDRSKVMLTFSVKDTGVGIRKKDKDKLFDVFAQFNSKNPYANQGCGVGLTVAKYYSNKMHGDIFFKSVYGSGSEFVCAVTQDIVDDAHLSESYVYDKNTRRQIVFTSPTARVLVVDDSKVNLGVAKGLLEEYGINVDIAESGMEALKKVGRKHYDLIFMDHMMPEMDGIETMKNIRNKGNWCEEVPVVALTANTTDEARQLFKMEGMQDFLAKPIELTLLHDILLKWIPKDKIVFSDISEGYIINDDLIFEGGNTAFTKSRLLKEGIYLEVGLPYFGGNIKAYKSTMESILKDCKKKVVLIENHFLAGDLKNYAIEAHSVKSVAASIGATAFSDLAKDNELKAKADDREYIEANGSYFITKYKEFLNSIEQILLEEKQHEAERQQETLIKELQANGETASDEEDAADERKVSLSDELSPEEKQNRKEGINQKIKKAIEAIEDFEADTAIEILQGLHTTDMDPSILEKLCRVSELIDDFEYDESVEILNKLLKQE